MTRHTTSTPPTSKNTTGSAYRLSKKDLDILEMATELEKFIYAIDRQNDAARLFAVLGTHLTFSEYRAFKDGWSSYLHTENGELLRAAVRKFSKRVHENLQTF